MPQDDLFTGLETRVLKPNTPNTEPPAVLVAHQPAQSDPQSFSGPASQDPFHSDPFIGRMVGNCRILEKINEGGSSFIYRALNVNFNLERVVKILKPALSDDQEYFERFKQEAQLTARLDHPNILRVFDTGEIGRQFFIEMEFVGGQSLREFINHHNRLRETDILNIGCQIAQALEYAHNVRIQAPSEESLHGILHRDLKPENIMLPIGGGLKLMDFGAAKPLSLNHKTLQGTIVGTPHYMSPEQINGEDLDARSDFFSLGIVLYELCTGKRPFDSDNLAALLTQVDACKYQPLRKLRPSISPLTEELVEKLLSKNPNQRPASAKEIIETQQIALRTLQQWGAGTRSKVPFSIRRLFPTMALGVSLVSLAFSLFLCIRFLPLLRNPSELKNHFSALVQKGIETENKGDIDQALGLYDLTPAPDKGGDPESFLISKLQSAHLYMTRKGQLTKARAILESLKARYKDPAIDAYLGTLYLKIALYLEAESHLKAALESKRQSALRHTDSFHAGEFRNNILFDLASAWDSQNTFIESNAVNKGEASKAYRRFIEASNCSGESQDKRCEQARKRIEELVSR